jgi:hypothetical protein
MKLHLRTVAAATLLAACAAPVSRPAATPQSRVAVAFGEADSVRVTTLRPGVNYVYVWHQAGPWAMHVIEIDERRCAPDIRALKAGPPLARTATTSALGQGFLAAVNTDFFELPAGTPIGAHVSAGQILAGPGARPVFAITADRQYWMGVTVIDGSVRAGRDSVELRQVNRPLEGGRHHPPQPGLTLFSHWYGDSLPVPADAAGVRVRLLPGDRSGVVTDLLAPGMTVRLDAEHAVFVGAPGAGRAWIVRRSSGDSVHWRAELRPGPLHAGAPGAATEAVGGFPLLVQDGMPVLAQQQGVIASFGENRHPRTAVAWNTAQGWSVWVAVDGRQPPYSDGMSLAELEWLALRIGATHAINLDGGGSTALVVRDRLVNRPSDREGERLVANVLALDGCL